MMEGGQLGSEDPDTRGGMCSPQTQFVAADRWVLSGASCVYSVATGL